MRHSQTTIHSTTVNRGMWIIPTHSKCNNQLPQTYQTSILALEQFWSPTVWRLGSQGVKRLYSMRWGPGTHRVTSQSNVWKGCEQRKEGGEALDISTLTAHQTLNWGNPWGTQHRLQQSKPFTQYTKLRFCLLQKWLAFVPQLPFQKLTGDNYLSVLL